MRLWLLCFGIAWFLCLTRPSEAARVAAYYHCYERMWLWEVYDFICDVEGPEKQGKILPWRENRMVGGSQASWRGKNNQGSGPGKRLTYVEFQNRLAGYGVDSLKYPDLTSPVDDMDAAVKDLNRNRLNTDINMDEAYPRLYGLTDAIFADQGNAEFFVANDQDRNRYIYWVDLLEKQVTEYRETANSKYLSDDRAARLKTLTTKIVTLRREGAYDSVRATLRHPTPAGFGLDEATIVTRERKSLLPEGSTYREVNVAQTFLNNLDQNGQPNQGLRDKGINNRVDLMNWIEGLVDPNNRPTAPAYSETSRLHWRIFKTWVHAAVNAERTVYEPEECDA